MKIKLSPLSIIDLAVIDFDYGFIPSKKTENLRNYFEEYDIDMNFAVKELDKSMFQVFVKAEINYKEEEQLPGYEIFCESVGLFKIDNNAVTNVERQSLISNSALVMVINFQRSFLATATSNFPFGKYWLPSLDLKDFLQKKSEAILRSRAVKKKVAKKK